MFHRTVKQLTATLLVTFLLAACGPGAAGDSEKIRVVATTTIVGDVVREVGGEAIDLRVMLPTGVDPHTFDPTPQDLAAVVEAEVVFANGVGLEAFLERMLENAGGEAVRVDVSEGIRLIELVHEEEEEEHEHEEGDSDPHVWFDPNNVMVWADNIAAALSNSDPANAEEYAANAEAYKQELVGLDAWIEEQVGQIPEDKRKLVTDHMVFSYFARRYGFEQVGAVVGGYSTISQPSAQELAELEDEISNYGVPTIFVGNSVNPSLSERVAKDTGTRLVTVYTGSLSEEGGPATSYLDFMRFNVSAIVEGLK